MTEKLREQVSALVDDELPAGELELLVRRFTAEKHLCICWERYHLIGEAMRKGLAPVDIRGFSDRIMAALSKERGMGGMGHAGIFTRFGKAVAGLAIAASVAMVAVIGLRHDTGRVQQAAAPSEIVPPNASLQMTTVAYGMVNNATWNGETPEVQAQLNNYVISHDEFATSLARQSMLPYVHLTTYGSRTQLQSPQQKPQHPDHRKKR